MSCIPCNARSCHVVGKSSRQEFQNHLSWKVVIVYMVDLLSYHCWRLGVPENSLLRNLK